ncbi:hypothetical protein [Spirosoma sordidisoli]|uniref:Uncharacterized protein n=1 Tax=Spirosoma sordidisoli TaxID=2502893 RepID=A0A4Q2ULQ4_9BACT|nr:hypothetical protein [Spirosoma sordidisoli]RYC69662.1 hypothetical protein EQG79_13760 [Spirosoma sordidisoli]
MMATAEKSKNPLQLFIDPSQLKELSLVELKILEEYVDGQLDRYYQKSKQQEIMPNAASHALDVMDLFEVASEVIGDAYQEKIRTYVSVKMPDGRDAVETYIPEEGEETPF